MRPDAVEKTFDNTRASVRSQAIGSTDILWVYIHVVYVQWPRYVCVFEVRFTRNAASLLFSSLLFSSLLFSSVKGIYKSLAQVSILIWEIYTGEHKRHTKRVVKNRRYLLNKIRNEIKI